MSWVCNCGYNNVVEGYDCLRCNGKKDQVADAPASNESAPYKYVPPPARDPTGPARIMKGGVRAVAVVTGCLLIVLGVSGGMLFVAKTGPFDDSCKVADAAVVPKGAPSDPRQVIIFPNEDGSPNVSVLNERKTASLLAEQGIANDSVAIEGRQKRWQGDLAKANFVAGAANRRTNGFSYGFQFSSPACADAFMAALVTALPTDVPTTQFDTANDNSVGLELSYSPSVPSTFIVATVVKERVLMIGESSGTGDDDAARARALELAVAQHRRNLEF